MWVTGWDQTNDQLLLFKVTTSDLSIVSKTLLGACTEGELDAKTHVAYPHCGSFETGLVYVYGNMIAPAGLSGTCHVIKTEDSGTSFSTLESGWGSDYCSVFAVSAADSVGNRNRRAIRSTATSAKFYKGVTGLGEFYTFDFTKAVMVDAFTATEDLFAVGAAGAGTVMIMRSADRGETWTDITLNHPADGSITSAVYL